MIKTTEFDKQNQSKKELLLPNARFGMSKQNLSNSKKEKLLNLTDKNFDNFDFLFATNRKKSDRDNHKAQF